jgi:hypothetical protein
MNFLLSLGFTKTYRRTAQLLADSFQASKNAALARRYMKVKQDRQNAAITLLLDDAKFHRVNPMTLLGPEHEGSDFKSAISEDFPNDY